ncbi:MAG TPA: SDR family NAD(P)-dependent oxidoreductase [Pseudonocardia sp.]|jgi:NAD(P)-dependent dehydrogenase (short-subunit alcohol dehydrogenase family)|nr:SDR family NAD(P)-dependent oxidoreductase [Pseudonocardia sp.]
MTTNIAHRTWFVTGANSGIGLALTSAALRRGDNVVGLARNLEPLKDLADTHPAQLVVAAADVRDQEAIDAAVAQGLEKFGRIDVVANNAGRGLVGAIEEITAEQVQETLDINVVGRLNVLRAVLPTLRAQRSGHVLELSSWLGQAGAPGFGGITMVKYAIEGVADALVEELRPLGIHVTLVEPGPSATNFRANLAWGPNNLPEYDQSVRAALTKIQALPEEHFNLAEQIVVAIMAAVDADEPPRRLATGSVAVNSIREHLHERLADLELWESISTAVDGDPARACPIT